MNRMHLAWAGLCLLPAWAQAVTCSPNFVPSNPDAIYTVHGDGTVTDTRTGLTWKQCLEGFENNGAGCTGAPSQKNFTWNEALALAASHNFAGHNDWRLPNIKELLSLVEECRGSPAINDVAFPGDPQGGYVHSSSPAAGMVPTIVWDVQIVTGAIVQSARSTPAYVRLVRGGPSFAALPVLSAVALSGTPTTTSAAMKGTSNRDATGYWLVVPRGSTPPTPAQVKAQAPYGGVTPVALGSGAMQADTPAGFPISGLSPETDYDFYLVADASGPLSAPAQKVPFTTAAVPVAGACGSAHNTGGTPLLASAPASALCNTGTASAVAGGTTSWGWSCTADTATACQAPRGYTVTPSAGANGGIGAAQTVAYGATASFTVTPAAGYVVDAVTSSCGGSLSGSTFTTGAVTAACTVSATFKLAPTVLPVPEGPQAGQPITLAPPTTNGWQITHASTQTTASTGTPPPPGVTLPHGLVRLRLELGAKGSAATVVLTYPQPLPPGAVYYRYGKTADDPQPHWFPFPGAVISGNTVTLTFLDGGAGDDDLVDDSVIEALGGVAVPAAAPGGATAIPTLGEWALALLAGVLGLFSLGALRRRGA
ncbi:IPTL-CTERM sorting domain-containing protein [Acidovorax sp. YS12]|nr:IPTL-CTERM sorting domain-containing protein [Acidovorax sp. YS12]